jgi:outer membrane protein assembly factor BamB
MIVGRIAKHSHALLSLLITLVVSILVLGMNVPPASESASPEAPAAEANSSPSVTCIPLGLYGNITAPVVVDKLSEGGDNLTFVGTSNGLYVVAPGGKLQHFLYSPFGIKHIALIDDLTGDGIREVVVALNDTQVPALRCYDGATWEKLWQFAPMAKIWDRLWVERQLSITSLEVISTGDSQSVVIASGRCVFSINAGDGTERWRFGASSALAKMATVAGLNGDDTDEVFAGSDDGHLYLLNGKTGEERWRTKLREHKGVNYDAIEHLVSDIVVLDEESGKVVVTSGDGWAQMFDLGERRREWDVDLTESDSYQHNLPITLVPDVTDDGLHEVVIVKGSSGYGNAQFGWRDNLGKRHARLGIPGCGDRIFRRQAGDTGARGAGTEANRPQGWRVRCQDHPNIHS